jgi:hypothetical protein
VCLYTPEYSGLWAPIWAADPVGFRDAVFAMVMCVFVAPTLWLILAPCVAPIGGDASRLRRHLRGRWSV